MSDLTYLTTALRSFNLAYQEFRSGCEKGDLDRHTRAAYDNNAEIVRDLIVKLQVSAEVRDLLLVGLTQTTNDAVDIFKFYEENAGLKARSENKFVENKLALITEHLTGDSIVVRFFKPIDPDVLRIDHDASVVRDIDGDSVDTLVTVAWNAEVEEFVRQHVSALEYIWSSRSETLYFYRPQYRY